MSPWSVCPRGVLFLPGKYVSWERVLPGMLFLPGTCVTGRAKAPIKSMLSPVLTDFVSSKTAAPNSSNPSIPCSVGMDWQSCVMRICSMYAFPFTRRAERYGIPEEQLV